MTKPEMLRAAIRFFTLTGRPPRRRDFRSPTREQWEATLGMKIPSADACTRAFGSWAEYVRAAGYKPDRDDYQLDVERAALRHVMQVYPDFEPVLADRSAYDGYLHGQRVEVKGSGLAMRKDGTGRLYFAFKTHGRDLTRTVDRLITVGVGRKDGEYVPLVRFDFPKSALAFVSDKSTVMIYASSIWGGGMSRYSPYIDWKHDLAGLSLEELARS